MKNFKIYLFVILTLVLSIGMAGLVYADNRQESDNNSNATSSYEVDNRDNQNMNRGDNSTSSDENDSNLSENHRNNISEVTKKLSEIGKHDIKIEGDIKDITDEESDVGTSTSELIKKVQSRNAFQEFLIGSDYKNLGALRSELVKTDNLVTKLNTLASSTASTTVQVELDAQIKALQDAQAKVKAFVTSHENSFSLFGWFMKLFNN